MTSPTGAPDPVTVTTTLKESYAHLLSELRRERARSIDTWDNAIRVVIRIMNEIPESEPAP
jgi:hypothetical protein